MQDHPIIDYPAALESIIAQSEALGFDMASEPKTGALLKVLAASKPGGRFLELGTGTGLSAAWLLQGMDAQATLVTVDNDPDAQNIGRQQLGADPRITFVCADAAVWLTENVQQRFDLIFADAWPGKFSHLDLALDLLALGGIYVIDDLLPQENWSAGHAPRVPALIEEIESKRFYSSVRLAWASGLMIVTRKSTME